MHLPQIQLSSLIPYSEVENKMELMNDINAHQEHVPRRHRKIPKYSKLLTDDHEYNHLHNKKKQTIDGTHVQELHEASTFSCYINLLNAIIGSGVLGLPYAFAQSGYLLGFILIVVAYCITMFSLHLLTICGTQIKPPASFYKVTEATLPKFSFLIDFSVFLMCFGCGISYLIVFSTLMPDVIDFFNITGTLLQRQIWVIIGFCCVAPLSCFKTIDALKYTSTLAMLFIGFIALLILTYAIDPSLDPCGNGTDGCIGKKSFVVMNVNTFRIIGVFIFAFSCQTNIFPVVNELRNPTLHRYDIVIFLAATTAFAVYSIVACAGYVTYGDAVASNILISYPSIKLFYKFIYLL